MVAINTQMLGQTASDRKSVVQMLLKALKLNGSDVILRCPIHLFAKCMFQVLKNILLMQKDPQTKWQNVLKRRRRSHLKSVDDVVQKRRGRTTSFKEKILKRTH